MSDSAFNKADKKIKLKEKIISNKHKQLYLFPEANKSLNPTRKHARFLDVDSSG